MTNILCFLLGATLTYCCISIYDIYMTKKYEKETKENLNHILKSLFEDED